MKNPTPANLRCALLMQPDLGPPSDGKPVGGDEFVGEKVPLDEFGDGVPHLCTSRVHAAVQQC